MEKLSSRSNEQVKFAVSLLTSAKARRESGEFLLEGARLCGDAALTGIAIKTVFLTAKAMEKYPRETERLIEAAGKSYEITNEISSRLSETQSPQGVFCVCKMLDKQDYGDTIDINGRYIALQNIQDPANLGAICRTAEALGITGAIISGGCDRYNPKAQRAAMGSLLRLSIVETEDLGRTLAECNSRGMKTFASTPDESAVPVTKINFSAGGSVCVIGNEGAGVSKEIMEICTAKVTIPMLGRAESLNASMAAAVLMWEMMRGE